MKITRFKQVSDYEVAQKMKDRMEFSAYQKKILDEVIRDLPYRFVVFEKVKPVRWYFRFTVPFQFIYCFMILIIMPLRYLFIGRSRYDVDGIAIKILKAWCKKTGIYIH